MRMEENRMYDNHNHEWKVGEYVLIANGFFDISKLGKVEQITKAGNIKVDDTIYYPSGRERTSNSFYVNWIRPITDEEANEFRKKEIEHKYILKIKDKIQKCELTYEQATKIDAILNS